MMVTATASESDDLVLYVMVQALYPRKCMVYVTSISLVIWSVPAVLRDISHLNRSVDVSDLEMSWLYLVLHDHTLHPIRRQCF